MSDYYVGEIRMFAGARAPSNWAFCDGQELSQQTYQALFSLIGTIWGSGSQPGTFKLPDLRGRLPVGQGAGTGLTPRTLGQTGGATTVSLSSLTMPTHTHTWNASSQPATAVSPSSTSVLASAASAQVPKATFYAPPNSPSVPMTQFTLNPLSVGATGNTAPHENRMPSLEVNFIIALNGIYPQRSS